MIVAMLAVVLSASWLLTAALRHYALRHDLLDHPNARSSHVTATPRGGGAAIVICFQVALLWLFATDRLEVPAFVALVGAGALVAAIGFIDDHRHMPPLMRLGVHLLAALWAVYWVGGDLPSWFMVVIVLGLIWGTNLYNFMDGIDGIAGLEAVTVCVGAALVHWLVQPTAPWWIVSLALAAASAGFLSWNFPRARIFMGDVGSGFLGVSMGVLALASGLYWPWLILIGAFVVDATLTLFQRLARGERIHQAHRSHAYQVAASRHGHPPVTLAVGAVNLVWLLPWAVTVALEVVHPALGIAIAFAPVVALVAYGKTAK